MHLSGCPSYSLLPRMNESCGAQVQAGLYGWVCTYVDLSWFTVKVVSPSSVVGWLGGGGEEGRGWSHVVPS